MAAALAARAKTLLEEWTALGMTDVPTRPARKRVRRANPKYRRLTAGLRTPETAYRIPILAILNELGGAAHVSDIRPRLLAKMDGSLNTHDRASLPSDPNAVRWWNAAMWCRNSLVKEGLLKADSPRGTWELTEKRREALGAEITGQAARGGC